MKYVLSFFLHGQEQKVSLDTKEITVGKLDSNTIILDDPAVSRQHCKIVKTPAGYTILDSGSTNGTFVNDKRIENHKLTHGDNITLGKTVLRFIASSPGFLKDENHRISVSIPLTGDLKKLSDTGKQGSIITDYLGKSYKFFEDLSEAENTSEVFRKTGEFISEFLTVQRVLIFSCNGDSRKLYLEYSGSSVGSEPENLQISGTIAHKALNEKIAIISSNTQEDSRFSKARSIILQGIKSAICVPLWTRESIHGLIYCDTDDFRHMFNEDDLIVVRNIANFAGIALENIRHMLLVNEERTLRNRLERYHSPAVVSRIMDRSDTRTTGVSGYRELEASVMFMDIAGFTSIVENLSPIQTGEFLNRIFASMTEIIFKYNGTLDKYTGDGIMAVFGAPFPFAGHAENAIKAAIEMQKAINQFKAGDSKIRIRIGIASGTIVDGDFGSTRRYDYTVLGNTVNIASRLESSIAEPGQILISEGTYKLAGNSFNCHSLGQKSLKGLSRPETPYRIVIDEEIQ